MAASSNCADYSGVHELDACGNGEVVLYQKVIQFPQRDSSENCDRVNPIMIRLKAKRGVCNIMYLTLPLLTLSPKVQECKDFGIHLNPVMLVFIR